MTRVLTGIALLLAGCKNDQQFSVRTQNDVFYQEPSAEVDILWVIDNSVSMEGEQTRVANGFESFIADIDETNIDFHIGIVTTDMDLDNPTRGQLVGGRPYITPEDNYTQMFQNRVQVGTDGSDKERGLQAAVDALTEPLASGANYGFLRPEATLSVIFVSDENDCSDNNALENENGQACYSQEYRDYLIPTKDVIDALKTLKDPGVRVLASAIVGPPASEACADSWPGARYRAVAEGTGGIVGNICDSDYSHIMGNLGLSVSGVLNTFQLTCAAVQDTISVVVDEDEIPGDPSIGWTYDSAYWMIRFDGSYLPPRGSTISVEYEVVSGTCGGSPIEDSGGATE
ncbi:MAG: hypothetical protein H6739_17160 [Alphaproteobacteria bacterium]|nr:hypothetical protein [Alphaproteobacteria bacterium]